MLKSIHNVSLTLDNKMYQQNFHSKKKNNFENILKHKSLN